jgi:dTDP-glucose 4,6-dehydratase
MSAEPATTLAPTSAADRQGHDRRYSLDITKIERELGYAPQVRFEEGLAKTIQWYRGNRPWWEPLRQRAALPEPTLP